MSTFYVYYIPLWMRELRARFSRAFVHFGRHFYWLLLVWENFLFSYARLVINLWTVLLKWDVRVFDYGIVVNAMLDLTDEPRRVILKQRLADK